MKKHLRKQSSKNGGTKLHEQLLVPAKSFCSVLHAFSKCETVASQMQH
jgi:hypothetical protein